MAVVDGDTKAVADQTEQHLNKDTSHFKVETFISGGIAGCVAKSLVAPIDRVKILLQVHNIHYEGYGIFESFVQVVQKEGFMSLYKGNGVQLIRIFPYAALQFSSYETYKSINKKIFKKNADNLLNGVVCGSMAGLNYYIKIFKTLYLYMYLNGIIF
jgi:solute carrier family 25 protein 16